MSDTPERMRIWLPPVALDKFARLGRLGSTDTAWLRDQPGDLPGEMAEALRMAESILGRVPEFTTNELARRPAVQQAWRGNGLTKRSCATKRFG